MGGDNRDRSELIEPRRRRRLLYCLCLYATPLKLGDIADQLARWESDRSLDRSRDAHLQRRVRIYDSLVREHLPALCDAGVVEYHRRDDMIEWGSAGAEIEPALRRQYSREATSLLAS